VTLSSAQAVYVYSGGYHFLVYVTDSQNSGLGGAPVALWINSSEFPPTPVAFVRNGTNGQGLAGLFADISRGNYSYLVIAGTGSHTAYAAGQIGGFGGNGSGGSPAAPNEVTFSLVSLGFWATYPALSVTALGPTGGNPAGDEVRYVVESPTLQPSPDIFPENQTTLMGLLSSVQTELPWNVPIPAPNETWVQFEVFAANGTYLTGGAYQGFSFLPRGLSLAGSSATDFLSALQPLIALLGLVLGYARYGKDRSLRTLESILWRPVSRDGIFLVRLGSVLLALGAGLVMLLAGLNLWLVASFGAGIPAGSLLVLFGVLLAEGAAFAGFMLLGSNLLRSRGGVIAVAAVSFVLFFLFFPILVALIGGLLGPSGVTTVSASASYWNPVQLLTPTYAVIVPESAESPGAFGGLATLGTMAGNPALLGIAAAAWFAVPSALAFVVAHFRD
jgi:ABC-type transport system involved in multi-copper enzyme maturation permease subunit